MQNRMSFARKTYDTDSIVLRTVIARTSTDQNISSGKVLVAQGDGSTAWMYPSTLPGIPAFTRVIGNGTEIVADNLSSALVLSTTDSMGMLTNSTTKEIRFYAKAFTTIDISGDNSVSAFNTTTNTLTPTVELVGAGGIQISSDPQTNQIFFQTSVPAISTGIYGYHQVNVLSNAPSTITDSNFSTNNTYLTATSPSTVLQLAGLGDIVLQTDTTNQVTYIGISTFTTASFQAVSTAAGLTQTTGSTLSTTIGSNTSSLWFSTNTAMNSTNTQFQANFNYINNFYTPLNDYQDLSTFTHSTLANTIGLSSFSTLEASTFFAEHATISSAQISSAVVQKEVVSTLEVSSATVNHAEISSLVVSSLTGIDFGGDFSTTLLYIQGPSNVAVGAEELRYIQGTSTLVIGDNVSTNYITVNAKDKSFNAISETVHPFLELGYYPTGDTNYSNVQMNDNSLAMYSDNPASEFAVLAENLRLQCANGTLQVWASSMQLLTSMYPQLPDSFDLGSSISRFREFYVSSMWAQNAELENVNISAGLNTLNISTGILNAGDTLNVYAPSTIFAGDIAVNAIHATGDILPTQSNTFDLGSSNLPWRDLYLSAASLYLSTTRVSLDATGNLTVAIGGGSAYTIGTTDAPVSSFASSFTNVAHVSSLIASSITAVNFIYLSSVQDSYYISTLNLDAQEVTFSTSLGAVTSTASLLASSVNGIKGSDLISTGQLTSTVTGLGTAGYISSAQLTSTVTGLGTAGYVSSSQLISTTNYLLSNATGSNISSLQVSSIRNIISPFTPVQLPGALVVNNVPSVFVVGGVNATSTNVVKLSLNDVSSLTNATGVQYTGSTIIRSVAFNGSSWLMATSDTTPANGRVYRSDTGASWTQVTLGGLYPTIINRIIYASTFWLAVGSNGVNSNYTIARSTDGSNWTSASSGGFGAAAGGAGESIAYDGVSRLVAIGWGFQTIPSPQFIPQVKYSDDMGLTWTTVVSITTTGLQLGLSVAYGNNLWLAGFSRTTGSNIKYSANGTSWTDVTTNVFPTGVTDFAYGGGRWVAVGGSNSSTIRYSTDGSNWTKPTNEFTLGGRRVIYSGSFFVATGDDGSSTQKVKYSTDGSSWLGALTTDFSSEGYAVAFSSNYSPSGYTLDVGQTTRLSNVLIPGTTTLSSLTVSSLSQMGVGIVSSLSVSSLTVRSESVSSATISSLTQVGSETVSSLTVSSLSQMGSGTISSLTVSTIAQVGTATFSTLAVSSFAFTTLATSSFTVSSLQSMTSNVLALNAYVSARNTTQRDLWIAVGDGGGGVATIKYSGNNGSNWSNSASGGFSGVGRDIGYNGNVWVAVGGGGSQSSNVLYSTDGSNWSTTTNGGGSGGGLCVAWNGRIWVAGFLSGTTTTNVQWSSNGFLWSNITASGFSTYMHDVGWNGRYWVGVGKGATSNATIQYSLDGLTWSNASSNHFETEGYAIAWNGKYWLAGGYNLTGTSNATIKYSTDGSNWSNSVSGGFTTNAHGFAWNGMMWVAIGNNGGATGSIKYSYDGLNWSNAASGGFSGEGRNIKWNGSRFIAVGNSATPASTIQASSDGINWTPQINGAFSVYPYAVGYSSNVYADLEFDNLEIYGKSQYPYMTSTNEIYMATSSLQINNLTLENPGIGRSNVGIGTTRPAERLDVNGGMLVGNTTASTGLLRITPFSNEMYIQAGLSNTTGSATKLHFSKFLTTSNAMTIDLSTMRVGIGTSTPVTLLHIARDSSAENDISSMITFENTIASYYDWQIGPTTINSNAMFVIRGGADGITSLSSIVNIHGNGNVGIRTTNPQYVLDVIGNCHISTGLFLDTNVSYGGLQMQNTAGNENAILIKDPGQTGFTGWMMGESVSFAPISTFFIGRVNAGTVNPSAAFYMRSNGNVGIGISSPTYTLDVNGNEYVTSTLIAPKNITFGLGNQQPPPISQLTSLIQTYTAYSTESNTHIELGSVGTTIGNYGNTTRWGIMTSNTTGGAGLNLMINALTCSTNTYNQALGTRTAMTIQNNGNVGIGTTSPNALLNVYKVGGYPNIIVGGVSTTLEFLTNESASPYQAVIRASGSAGARLDFENPGNYPRLSILPGGSVGIGTTSPSCQFQVNGSTSNASGTHFAAFTGLRYDTAASTLMASMNTSLALMTCVGTTNDLIIYYRAGGQNRVTGIVGSLFFTGQHANVSVDSNLNTSTLTDHVGKIVRSTGKYMSYQNGSTITGKDAIFTTEALPTIELVSKDMDKSVWGVVTNHRNDTYNDDGTPMLDHQSGFGDRIEDRIRINGVGEGAIWITNINGNLENGDYICSSAVPGYGRKQDDDLLHNYTVAKITMDCPFELAQEDYVCEEFEWNGSTLRKAYVGCTYHCS